MLIYRFVITKERHIHNIHKKTNTYEQFSTQRCVLAMKNEEHLDICMIEGSYLCEWTPLDPPLRQGPRS